MEKITDEQLKREMVFHLYGRFVHARNIINANRKKNESLRILDVGGMGNWMKRIFPGDHVYYLDPLIKSEDENFIKGDGCDMPLEDESFDWVISTDVFEHIPKGKRKMFLEENLRVAKKGVILVAPFWSKEVERAEVNANENYRTLTGGHDHVWLKEHIDNGLPHMDEFEKLLTDKNLPFQKLYNNRLFLWQILIGVEFFAGENYNSDVKSKLEEFSYFYNKEVAPFDNEEPSYRKVYFIKKDPSLKDIEIETIAIDDGLFLKTIKNSLNLVGMISNTNKEHVRQKNHEIEMRDMEIVKIDQDIRSKNLEVDGKIQELNLAKAQLGAKSNELSEIYSSRGWRLIVFLRKVLGYRVIKTSLVKSRDFARYHVRSTFGMFRFWLTMMNSYGGAVKLARKVIVVARRGGMRNISFKAKNIYRYYKKAGKMIYGVPYPEYRNDEGIDLSLVVGGPTITVIIPVYNTPIKMLSAAIASVQNQLYEKWELIIVDDNSKDGEVLKTIRFFSDKDARIKVITREKNGNISNSLNSGIEHATGDFMTVLDHDDTLDWTALYWVVRKILENPTTDYIYSDEDKMSKDGKNFYGPFFKPDWSPEYMLAMMYTCHMSVYRLSIVREIKGYRSEFDGAQDYDLTLRYLNRTARVAHVPKVLYHWRVWEQSTAESLKAKPYAEGRARKALSEFLDSRGENYIVRDGPLPGHNEVVFLPKGNPLVSIVIITANARLDAFGKHERHIDGLIDSIYEKTAYSNYEIIVVHNGLFPEQEKSFKKRKNLKLIRHEAKVFNLPEKLNFGCAHAKGEYLVTMNDDIRIISKDWLDQLTGMVQRDGVGVVGLKLLFPDETIQHAGVVLLGGLPGHAYYQWPKDADGYALGLKVSRNYLAVTGACTITPKWLYDKVGGYSERYPLNYNDVDYCLKLQKLGYRSVYLASVELYHFEGSSTKKTGSSKEVRRVSPIEIEKFLEDWGDMYLDDPYYNPNLSQSVPYQF